MGKYDKFAEAVLKGASHHDKRWLKYNSIALDGAYYALFLRMCGKNASLARADAAIDQLLKSQ